MKNVLLTSLVEGGLDLITEIHYGQRRISRCIIAGQVQEVLSTRQGIVTLCMVNSHSDGEDAMD
jgi:hypothetical protein